MTTLMTPAVPPTALPHRPEELPTDALRVLPWAGGFGVTAVLLLVAAMPLYVVRRTPPPLEDSAAFAAYLTRNNTNVLTGLPRPHERRGVGEQRRVEGALPSAWASLGPARKETRS